MNDIDYAHELALIEDAVRVDTEILKSDPRIINRRTPFTKGFDAAVQKYALMLGLLNPEDRDDGTWFV